MDTVRPRNINFSNNLTPQKPVVDLYKIPSNKRTNSIEIAFTDVRNKGAMSVHNYSKEMERVNDELR
jgi:hypothetical protein